MKIFFSLVFKYFQVCTGRHLSKHLVQTVFQIFDDDGGRSGGDDGSNTHKRTLLSKHILPHICLHHTLN